MTLIETYRHGVKTAFARFGVKLALPLPGGTTMGACYGIMPTGNEMAHGTDRIQYARRGGQGSAPAEQLPQGQFNGDWLWKNQDLKHMAPDNVSGWGTETIG